MNMDINLTENEQKHLDTLISNAQRNKIEAQQLALDAGKLLSITKERLDDYKERGFFKRCWYKFSGKQGELARANQNDLIAMQKFAWAFLMKLQEQNLIQAQAIAVIRNNLRDIIGEIGQIHDMVSLLVDKFDRRLTQVEQKVESHDWLLGLDINEKLCKDSEAICTLQLTFDYLGVLNKNNIDYSSVENGNYLKQAIKRIGFDPNQKYTVEKFISQLFEEMQRYDYKLFRDHVILRVNQKEIKPEYILENISGVAYNALYSFVADMDHMGKVAKHLEKDNPQETTLRVIRSSLNNPNVEYTLAEYAEEILCGSILTEEFFKKENGIVVESASEPEAPASNSSVIDDLIGKHLSISYHAFLKDNPDKEEKSCYLESFSIILAELGGMKNEQRSYLNAVAKLFDCTESLERLELLIKSPRQIDIKAILSVLDSSERQCIWIVDALLLGNLSNDMDNCKNAVSKICKIFNFKENEINPFLDAVEIFITTDKANIRLEQLQNITRHTDAWKTILDFKRISLTGAFEKQQEKLRSICLRGTLLSTRIILASSDCIDWAFTLGEENFLQRKVISIGRSLGVSKFKEKKKEAEAFKNSAESAIHEANSILFMFGTETIDPSGNLYNINADETTDCSNENWGDNMDSAFEHLHVFVDQLCNVASLLSEQLTLYENGKYSESAIKNREKAEKERQEQNSILMEKEKTVKLTKGNTTLFLRIDFKRLHNLPFDHQKVKKIVCNGYCWFVLEKGLYKSQNAVNWSRVNLPSSDSFNYMEYMGDTLILWSPNQKKFCFSRDGETFFKGEFPLDSSNEALSFYNGMWYLQAKTYREYSYVQEGILWNSDETSSCSQTELYSAENLFGPWKLLRNLSLPEGIFISDGAFLKTKNVFVALCAYDYFYRKNKHIKNRGAHFAYATKDDSWREAIFPKEVFQSYADVDNEVTGKFFQVGENIVCASAQGIFISEDGRKWTKSDNDFTVSTPCRLDIGNLFCVYSCRGWGYQELLISMDGSHFQKMHIDQRTSSMAVQKDKILLVDTREIEGGVFWGKVITSEKDE